MIKERQTNNTNEGIQNNDKKTREDGNKMEQSDYHKYDRKCLFKNLLLRILVYQITKSKSFFDSDLVIWHKS